MPNYSYHCDVCGLETTRYVRLVDFDAQAHSQRCERCESTLRKLISVPMVMGTDTIFMGGLDDGFGNDNFSRQKALAKARAAGIDVTGKKFNYGLCRRGVPLDPLAWYDGKEDVKRKVQKLGARAEGMVNVEAPVFDADLAAVEKPYRVAPHVVADDVDKEIKEVHGGKVTAAKRKEITEKHRDAHSGRKVKSKVNLWGK